MGKKLRNTLIFAAKLLVAGGLLCYVLGKVHWHDYAVRADGDELRVLATRTDRARPLELQVRDAATGELRWLGARRFRPLSLTTAEGETAIIRECRPDWKSPKEYLVQLPDGQRRWQALSAFVPGSGQVVRRGFFATLRSAEPFLLLSALVCFAAPNFILAVRWWYLLRILAIHISLWEAVRLTFLGLFFNFVVPGTVSGDVVKAYYASKHTERKAAVLVSVFVDRAVGLLEFAVLPAGVMVAMSLTVGWNERLYLPAAVVAVVLAGVTVSLSLLLSPGLRRLLRLQKIISRLPMQRHIAVVGQAANLYRRRAGALLKVLGITFCGQVFFIAAIMLAGMSLDIMLPWYQYFLYVPLIYIIAAVPISPGGLGLTETFYVTFLTSVGAAASEVLALAVVARLVPMIFSLPGVVVALKGPRIPRPEQMQAEMAMRSAD